MVSLKRKLKFSILSGLNTFKIWEILLGMKVFGIWIFIRKTKHQLREVTFVANQ